MPDKDIKEYLQGRIKKYQDFIENSKSFPICKISKSLRDRANVRIDELRCILAFMEGEQGK